MDMRKTGQLIGMLRKERGMTQKELADKINVTDKAVSRWETGKGFPEPSTLRLLAEALGTSITELVNGERSEPERRVEKAESAVVDTLLYAGGIRREVAGAFFSLFGVTLSLLPLYAAGQYLFYLLLVGEMFVLTGARIILLFYGQGTRTSMRAAGALSLGTLLLALALEAAPYGVVLLFAPGPGERVRRSFSYFSLTPVGYGDFLPLLAGALTVLAAVCLTVTLIRRETPTRLQAAAGFCTGAAFILAVLPALLDPERVSAAGVGITALLLASMGLQTYANGELARRNSPAERKRESGWFS